ncbi:YihY/virulence factor BrkB family protein [Sphingomonas piscis]|nr:YihY/virulence factor BrkB family protein [Sphingomonas piscis]
MPSTRTIAQSAADRGRHADSPWQMPLSAWKEVAVRTWGESSKDNVGLVAAGVAFYGFLALVPLLGAIVLTYGLVASPRSVLEHVQGLTQAMPADVAKIVGEQLLNVVQTSGGKKGLGLIAALAVALWGARNAMGSIVTALNIAYEEEEKRGFLKVTLISLVMTVCAVLVALLAIVATTVLGALEDLLPSLGMVGIILSKGISYVVLLGAAAAAIATLYRYGPSRDNARWTWITPGSLFAAIAWLALTLGFGFYVTNFGSYDKTYGSLGAVVVLLTWLYLSSYVLLFGAELNSELEHQTAKDTTAGADKPLGSRGAWSADHVASGPESADQAKPAAGEKGADSSRPNTAPIAAPSTSEPAEHPYLASRVTSRASGLVGAHKIGMVSSILSTVGLGLMRRRGSELAGAAILAAAAGLALARREDG